MVQLLDVILASSSAFQEVKGVVWIKLMCDLINIGFTPQQGVYQLSFTKHFNLCKIFIFISNKKTQFYFMGQAHSLDSGDQSSESGQRPRNQVEPSQDR